MSATFYCVRKGRNPGIYNTWEEARFEVDGFPGAEFRKFKTRQFAWAYMESDDDTPSQESWTPVEALESDTSTPVHHPDTDMRSTPDDTTHTKPEEPAREVPPSQDKNLHIVKDYVCVPGQVYLKKAILAGCVQYGGHTILVSKRGVTYELVGNYQAVIEPLIDGEKMPGPLDSIWNAERVESTEIISRRKFTRITIRLRSGRRWELHFKPSKAPFVRSVLYRTKRVMKPIGPKMMSGRRLDEAVWTEDETDAEDPDVAVFQ